MRKTKMSKKDLLFYSNYCEYSKEILTYITKKNIRHMFLLICIDSGKYNIPPIITSVPTILKSDHSRIFTDQDIQGYINSRIPVNKEESIQTFSWEGSGYSEPYSLIDDNDNGNMSSMQYTFINDSQISNSKSPSKFQDDEDVLKQSKFDISAYDSYISSRNKDEEVIKKTFNPNNYDRII